MEKGLVDDFVEKKNRDDLVKRANAAFPTLIGKKAPNITVLARDSSRVELHALKAKYTLMFVYAPDCGHCQTQSPLLVKFLEDYVVPKKLDMKIITLCSYIGLDKMPDCWKYVDEKKFGGFINTIDPFLASRYKILYNIEQTPQLFLLDENKVILSKGFEAKQLPEVMDGILGVEPPKN
jgi:thiol-disulfide isomerase/thioredoxin